MGVELPPILASIKTVDYKNLQNGRLEDGPRVRKGNTGIYFHLLTYCDSSERRLPRNYQLFSRRCPNYLAAVNSTC